MRVHPIRVVRYSLILVSSFLLYEIVTGIGRSARYSAESDSQMLIDYLAVYLRVQMRQTDVRQRHQIVLTNSGTRDIPLDVVDWKIYFNLVRVDGDEQLRSAYNLSIVNIDGWLRSLQSTAFGVNRTASASDRTLRANESIALPVQTDLKSTSYAFPRWYVVGGPDTKPRILQSTDGDSLDFVESFGDDSSPHRYTAPMDITLHSAANATAARMKPILPTPLSFLPPPDKAMDASASTIRIGAGWSIVYTEELYAEAVFIAARLDLPLSKSNGQESNCIRMQVADLRGWLASAVGNKTSSTLHFPDAYVLRILRGGVILINGQSAAGVFYGIQSLLSLLESSADRRTLPVLAVVDAPRFAYRGLMLDVARNFIDADEVLRLLDVMAMYKMNKLHLHLTDDQGWRFEVPGLPELTEVGSHRGHVPGKLSDYDHLPAYLGSGPFLDNPAGNGFYSVSDYRKILKRASQLHVDVIPEIDLPGHSHAAIQSMRVRERRRRQQRKVRNVPAQKKTERLDVDSYALDDPDDRSHYLAVNDYRDTVVNPCMESTFKFVEHVLNALKELHKDIQPLTVVHLGGDEVPPQALTGSPLCLRLIKQRPELAHRLKTYFMERAFNISSGLGLQIQTWEEGVIDHATVPIRMSPLEMSNTFVQAWNNEPAYQRGNVAYSFANKGFKVILSHASHLYLDHPSESNRDEPGLFWAARSSSLAKMFSYLPALGDVPGSSANSKICRMYSMPSCFNLTRPENIAGIEACLWSELIRNGELAEYMTLPRLLAVAERAWHVADWQVAENDTAGNIGWHRDWDEFRAAVGTRELRRLERIGMQYRLAPPGVSRRGKKVQVSTEFAGQPVQYSADDGRSWNNFTSSLDATAATSSTLQFVTRSVGPCKSGIIFGSASPHTPTEPVTMMLMPVLLLGF